MEYRPLITTYIEAAMARAQYERLEDGTCWASVPSLQGVWSNADCQENCQLQLREVLEEWILVRLRHDLPMPDLDGIDLSVKAMA